MAERLISADNHIDMTLLSRPTFGPMRAPSKWHGLVPRTDERE